MGPRHTAVSSLSYSTGSRSRAEAGRASAKTIGNGVYGGGWLSAKTGFLDAESTPSRFPADRRGDHDVARSLLVDNVLPIQAASRAALHVKVGSRT
jgi:hypothetical protein